MNNVAMETVIASVLKMMTEMNTAAVRTETAEENTVEDGDPKQMLQLSRDDHWTKHSH